MDNLEHVHHGHRHRRPPHAPKDFTAILITKCHRDFEALNRRHRHHHHHHGVVPMNLIAFAWINATTRKDGSALDPSLIASSIISEVNADGTTTAVDTVIGNGTTASISAPTAPGTYKYQVQNVDTNGDIGDPVSDAVDVVIAAPAPAAPSAPSGFTATLEAGS